MADAGEVAGLGEVDVGATEVDTGAEVEAGGDVGAVAEVQDISSVATAKQLLKINTIPFFIWFNLL